MGTVGDAYDDGPAEPFFAVLVGGVNRPPRLCRLRVISLDGASETCGTLVWPRAYRYAFRSPALPTSVIPHLALALELGVFRGQPGLDVEVSTTKPGESGRALIVSASLDPESRSERIAQHYAEALVTRGVAATFVTLKDYDLPGFDNPSVLPSDYKSLHGMVLDAEAVVLASPIYNWGCSAELKRFIEFVGSTPPDESLRGAFFDKIVTFIASAASPLSYMGFAPAMASMILDFKCIINPYHVYVHNQHWDADRINDDASSRIERSADVLVDLMRALRGRAYASSWDV